MSSEVDLVDEIVRRILEEFPSVVRDASSTPPTVAASSVPRHEQHDSAPAPASSGRLHLPPTRFDGEPGGTGTTISPSTAIGSESRVGATAGSGATATPPARPTGTSGADAIATSIPVIRDRVITAELLLKQIGQSSTVRVGSKSLLTPSARDVIRNRRLEVIRESNHEKANVARGDRWLVIASSAGPAVAKAIELWRSRGRQLGQLLAGDAVDAASQAISALCRGDADQILLVSNQPDWTACLSNRNDKVRAVALHDVGTVATLRDTMKPNVWSIDANKRSSFEITNLFQSLDI